MQIQITAPTHIETTITLPSSKSICNRALIIHALAHSELPIHNLSDCDDTQVMVKALQSHSETIDILAAGTAMRFLTAYYATQSEETHTITGTQRMQQRPIRLLVDALRTLGADITYLKADGFPPLHINGKNLTGNEVSLPSNVSSQYISALLMIAPMLPHGLTLHLTGVAISRPYIELTLKLMKEFGASVDWADKQTIRVDAQPYRPRAFTVESDWSAASYWYQIAALCDNARIELPGLWENSYQGDSIVARLFEDLGVKTDFAHGSTYLTKGRRTCHRMDYNFIDQPDLAQTFVVLCALVGVPFRFSGLQSLKIKETDRMAALITEMRKLGYIIRETDNSSLTWDGERTEPDSQPAIDTYDDHRMAMAFAPAAFRFPNLRINQPQVVSKSYPHFWNDLTHAGFTCTTL